MLLYDCSLIKVHANATEAQAQKSKSEEKRVPPGPCPAERGEGTPPRERDPLGVR